MPLQIRRGTNAQRQILAVPLASGELLWTTDTQQLFIGDGNTLANALTPVVGYNDENAQDAAAAIFTNGSHTDITFNYVDGANRIDADVSISAFRQNVDMSTFDLSGSGDITTTGTITAGAFRGDYKGTIVGDDSTTLVNAVESSINLDGTVKGNIIPNAQEAYDIGSPTNRFKDLYLSGSSLYLGNAQIVSNGTSVDLPAGSTVNGIPLGDPTPGSQFKIDIVGDDSTVLVNTVNSSINLDGTVKGDIIPDADLAYDIGSGSRRFNDLYLSGSSIFLGDAVINSVGTAVNLPSGSTIGGEPLGAATFAGTDLNVNIIGDDSSVIVNSASGNINAGNINAGNIEAANVTGTFVGDITGSVFADDSTLIIDGIDRIANIRIANIDSILANTIQTSQLTINNSDIQLNNDRISLFPADNLNTNSQNLRIISNDSRSILRLIRQSNTDISSDSENHGAIFFGRDDISGEAMTSFIIGTNDAIYISGAGNSGFPNSSIFTLDNLGNLGLGTDLPAAKLDVQGDAIFLGDVQAAAFKGSVVGDDSTIIVDAINNTITSGGFIQFGSYTDGEIADITPANGMVYYNSTDNKFRGYQNGGWINLDDGTAA